VFSSFGVTVLYFLENKNQQSTTDQQQELLKQLQRQQSSCQSGPQADKKLNPAPTVPQNPTVEAITELKTEDITVGTGAEVKAGDCVDLFFHGTLAKDGKAFQGGSNYAEAIPYRSVTTGFVTGFGNGLVGMKAGGKRRIFIPAAQGYGDQASGEIPANADLIFTVRVIDIVPPQ